MKLIITIFLLSSFSQLSLAAVGKSGISLNSAYSFVTVERQQDLYAVQNSKISSSYLNTKLNYALTSGFFFGVSWVKSKGTISGLSLIGPNIGFNLNGFSFGASYFPSPKFQFDQNIEYSDGTAFIIELEYHLPITSYFFLGANISYISEKYNKVSISGVESDSIYKNNYYTPFVSIGFLFNPFESGYDSY